jgi:hypothetical protein
MHIVLLRTILAEMLAGDTTFRYFVRLAMKSILFAVSEFNFHHSKHNISPVDVGILDYNALWAYRHFNREDGDSMFLRNVGIYVQAYMPL